MKLQLLFVVVIMSTMVSTAYAGSLDCEVTINASQGGEYTLNYQGAVLPNGGYVIDTYLPKSDISVRLGAVSISNNQVIAITFVAGEMAFGTDAFVAGGRVGTLVLKKVVPGYESVIIKCSMN